MENQNKTNNIKYYKIIEIELEMNDKEENKRNIEKSVIYKILTEKELNIFKISGEFNGTLLDIKDGYIHMSSTEEQVKRVKNKYYQNEKVYLLEIDASKLDNLKYEKISNGDIYPHQYGKLLLEDVISTSYLE